MVSAGTFPVCCRMLVFKFGCGTTNVSTTSEVALLIELEYYEIHRGHRMCET
jgi:hypothetical protein